MRRRILYIIPTLGPSGAGRQLTLLAGALPRDEFEVHVCALGRGGLWEKELRDAGVEVTVIGRRCWFDLQAYWRLKRHITGLRPDLVHTWLFEANLCGGLIARLSGAGPVIGCERSFEPGKSRLKRAAERCLARQATLWVVNTPALRDDYLRHGFPAEKIEVIPDGVAPIEPSSTTRRQLLAELGLPEGSRLIGAVGRLVPRKRLKDAIWSADLLKVIRPDVHLLVIGDGPHRDRLLKFRDQVVIRDKVHFLGVRRDVARLLPHLDVFWSPGESENQPLAVMEAMMAGVAVVASDTAAHRELIVSEESGCLAPVGNRAALARCTNQLLDNAELAHRLGQAGRQRIEREYAVERMVQRYAELYRRVLGNLPDAPAGRQ